MDIELQWFAYREQPIRKNDVAIKSHLASRNEINLRNEKSKISVVRRASTKKSIITFSQISFGFCRTRKMYLSSRIALIIF